MNLRKFGIQAGILSMAALIGQGASAADKELLDILLANGSITQEQYDHLLKKKEPLTKKDVEVTLGKKGLQIKTSDGDFKMKIGGRMHLQAAYHDKGRIDGQDINDGLEIRRGRLAVKGVIFRDWKYQAEYEFAGNQTHIKDLWLAYTGLDWMPFIGIGHQKQPYSLEVEMSSNDIPFIERALDYGISESVVDRALGLRLQSHGKHWFVATGLYGESIGKGNDEGWGTAGRVIFSPIISQEQVLHLGVRGAFRQPNDDREQDFRYKSTHQSGLYLVNTGTITNVDSTSLIGAEAAMVFGPFGVEGEYTHAMVDRRKGGKDLGFDGFHVQATWSLTGESKATSYKISAGEFKRLKPHQYFSLSQGGIGAWELAARYGWIDLNDKDIKGGKAQDFTVALNWYLNPNIRMMFDYTHVFNNTNHGINKSASTYGDAEGLNIFQVRGQLTF